MCSSPQRVYIFVAYNVAGVWAVGRLGVGSVTAAVDWQARQSCRVWCAGVN